MYLQPLAHQLALFLAGGKLQEPQSEPGGFPGKYEAIAHHGRLQVEHKADRPLGPGQQE